jgi:hypothetical protein
MMRFPPIPSLLMLGLVSAWGASSPLAAAEEATAKTKAKAADNRDRPKKGARKSGVPAPAEEGIAEEVVKGALPQELTSSFPIGREFKGVAIPSYANNVLKSVMTAATVVRIDEQFLDLVDLTVLVYNSAGEPETTISMDEASYDLVIGELASKTPSRIEQPRFTMTGDKMTFQAATQTARLVGNVKVIVSDIGDLAPGFAVPAKAGEGAKADPATP